AECTTAGRVCFGLDVDTCAGGLYGSGGGASGVVEVGVVGGGVPLSARAWDTQHRAANTTTVATAGAPARGRRMAASPSPLPSRACPGVASCGADSRVNSRPPDVFRVRAAPRALSCPRSNDLFPPELPIAPLPG